MPNAAADESPPLIGRQAILDAKHAIFGYELFDRSTRDHSASSDVSLVFRVLSHVGEHDVADRKTLFVNCTHESLGGGHLELVPPSRLVLEIPPVAGNTAAEIVARTPALAELHRRHFPLAFDHSVLAGVYSPWQPLAQFVKIDLTRIPAQHWGTAITRAHALGPQVKVVCEKIETPEQFETVRKAGADYFQGYWFAKPTEITSRVVSPTQSNILQLINLVRSQAATEEIEKVLKKDAILAFNLLRLINSAGFSLSREITSFREAVMLLGLKRLFRWAAMLLTAAQAAPAAASVGNLAVVRGRLCELLAQETGHTGEDADNAFVVGVFSLLDVMLGIPMDRALALVSLPQSVRDALLTRTGPYAQFLSLTQACETGDDNEFAQAAHSLTLSSAQVNMAHLQALTWADQVG